MHYVQKVILRELLFNTEAKFSELNSTNLLSDHFSYHLNILVKKELIKKSNRDYSLTERGKILAAKIDIDSLEIINQPLVGIGLFIIKDDKFLLEERKYNPNAGLKGFHSEKVIFGESFFSTANRCLAVETGFKGEMRFAGTIRMIRSLKNLVSFDVILHYFRIVNPKGELLIETKRSINSWFKFDEVENIDNVFPDFLEDFKYINSEEIFFSERLSRI